MSAQETLTVRESRWPAVIAIAAALILLEFLPARLRIMPLWFPYVAALALIIPIVIVALTGSTTFMRVERAFIYLFAIFSVIGIILTLSRLIDAMISPTKTVGGNILLASAIAVWVINIIAFALLYWEMDRGGPEERACKHQLPADILFPEHSPETDNPRSFIDYLFFAYCCSTAFSPTETYPLSTRLKALMMVQSIISLVTVVIVASRAVNILK